GPAGRLPLTTTELSGDSATAPESAGSGNRIVLNVDDTRYAMDWLDSGAAASGARQPRRPIRRATETDFCMVVGAGGNATPSLPATPRIINGASSRGRA